MKKLVIVLVLAVILAPSFAFSTVIAVGDSWDSGSWSQAFYESDNTVDRIEWFITDGTGGFYFEGTGIENIGNTDGSWGATLVTNHYSVMAGNDDNYLTFDGHFSGNVGDGTMETLWLGWLDDTLIEYGTFNKNGGNGWVYTGLDMSNYNPNDLDRTAPVPEPSTFVLLGAGLAGLAYYRRKKS